MDKYNHWLPALLGKLFGNPNWAITLGQTAYYSVPSHKVDITWRRHENCHKLQWRKEGVIKFTVKYLYEWIRNFYKLRNFNEAYRAISYEVEARKAESDNRYNLAILAEQEL